MCKSFIEVILDNPKNSRDNSKTNIKIKFSIAVPYQTKYNCLINYYEILVNHQ